MQHSKSTACPVPYRALASAALLTLLLAAGDALAVSGGQIAAGSGQISANGDTTNVQQTSGKMVVNWSNFDIGQNQIVNIRQPDRNAAILNRVVGADATSIHGALNANGRVFVVNPNGIAVGQDATINVNSVVLSAIDVSDSDFMSGGALAFRNVGGTAGTVRNDGTINTRTGLALIGANAVNGATGRVSVADTGTLILATGNKVALTLNPDGSTGQVTITEPSANALVANDGELVSSMGAQVQVIGELAAAVLPGIVNTENLNVATSLAVLTGGATTRGATVAAGTGSVAQSGQTTNVTQTSDRLVLNWQNFNTKSDESINFVQPNANSAVLNRVQSGNVTTFDGALNANGRVFVLNPNGIVVGQGATLNANSVTLAAADTSDDDFINKRSLVFTATPDAAGVVQNSGVISTKTGIALVGQKVDNFAVGRLSTFGNVGLAAGGQSTMTFASDGSMSGIQVDSAAGSAHVANDGRITADGGFVSLLARATDSADAQIARNRGQIDAINRTADSGTDSGPGEGDIVIAASTDGGGGTIDVRGRLTGQNVTIANRGGKVDLYDGAVLSTQSTTPSYAVTLLGNSVEIASTGANVNGNLVIQGVGDEPQFVGAGPLQVVNGTVLINNVKYLK